MLLSDATRSKTKICPDIAPCATCWAVRFACCPMTPCTDAWTSCWPTNAPSSRFFANAGRCCSRRASMFCSTNGQQTNTLKGLPASTPAPVYLRRYKHPYDGQELKVHGRRRHADGRHFLNVEMADGQRFRIPENWTTLSGPVSLTPGVRGSIAAFLSLLDRVELLEERYGLPRQRHPAGASGTSCLRGTTCAVADVPAGEPGGVCRATFGADDGSCLGGDGG